MAICTMMSLTKEKQPHLVSVPGNGREGKRPLIHLQGLTKIYTEGDESRTVLDELERSGKETALTTLCIGAGMATATIIERV